MALFWSFFNRRPRGAVPARDAAPDAVPAPGRETPAARRFPAVFPDDPTAYEAFRDNDARLKLWLPPPVVEALERVEQTGELNRPALLRELLFCYVYGAYDLQRMRELGDGLYWRPGDGFPLFSRPPRPVVVREGELRAELGKSTVDLLLWLPRRLREDLDALAAAEGVTPSQFARHVLVAELFGRHYLNGRRRLLVEALSQADRDAEDMVGDYDPHG